MKTIYYLSNIKWYSHAKGYKTKQEALKKHINYVINSKDFRFALGDAKHIIKRSKEADKRVNSRIACSFVFALPNEVTYSEVKKIMEEIRKKIAIFNNMREEDIWIGFHDSKSMFGNENKHLHIVLVNLDQCNKSIRIGRSRNEIKEFHHMMQKFLIDKEYKIRKTKEENRIEHLGVKLRWDNELRELYQEYLQTRQEIKYVLAETKKEPINTIDEEERKRKYYEEKMRKIRYAEEMLKGKATEDTTKDTEEDINNINIDNPLSP